MRPKAIVTVTERSPGIPSVQVTLFSPAVTRDDVLALFARANTAWGDARRHRVDAADAKFLAIVRATGPVPASQGAKEFWTAVLSECRRTPGQPNYEGSGWRGPYNRYSRLVALGVVQQRGES